MRSSRAPSMIAIVPDNTVVGRFVRVMDSDAARTVMALYSRAAGVFTAVLLEEWCSNWRTATSALSVINSSEDLQAASQSPVGSFWQDTASRRREEKLKKMINSFLSSSIGKFIILGITWSFSFQVLSEIRHLIMDLGYGFELKTTRLTGLIVIIGSIVLTVTFYFMGKNFI